jgi:cation transport regulator
VPYKTNQELPEQLKALPGEAQTIFRKAFNASFAEYGEDSAHKIAWDAVKKVYEKDTEGNWKKKKQINAFVNIVCKKIEALSGIDILKLIPQEKLQEIKQKDPHPYFQAYSICHEGTSTPTVIGEGPKPIHWTKKAIQSLKNIITKGVKFFMGHNEDNSTENRQELGEVVADTQQEIDGELHHIVVGYFPDKEKVANTDICSQEANWDLFETAKNYIADKITELTGIALGNSDYERPAFKGAKRLAMVQAFKIKAEETGQKIGVQEMDLNTIPFDTLIGELKRRNFFPSEAFTIDDLKADRNFKSLFDDTKIKQLEEKLKVSEDKIKVLEGEKVDLGKQIQVSTASKRFEKLLNEQEDPLTGKQKLYLKTHFNTYLEQNRINDVTDEGLNGFITNKLGDYRIDTESGVFKEVDDLPINENQENINVEPNDYTKTENNPLLKEDYEAD